MMAAIMAVVQLSRGGCTQSVEDRAVVFIIQHCQCNTSGACMVSYAVGSMIEDSPMPIRRTVCHMHVMTHGQKASCSASMVP